MVIEKGPARPPERFAAHGRDDPIEIFDAGECVDLGISGRQIGFIAFAIATGHDDFGLRSTPFEGQGVLDRPFGFLLRRGDKAARVENDDVRLGRVGDHSIARPTQDPGHHFAIDEVFRATERDEGDGVRRPRREERPGSPGSAVNVRLPCDQG